MTEETLTDFFMLKCMPIFIAIMMILMVVAGVGFALAVWSDPTTPEMREAMCRDAGHDAVTCVCWVQGDCG